MDKFTASEWSQWVVYGAQMWSQERVTRKMIAVGNGLHEGVPAEWVEGLSIAVSRGWMSGTWLDCPDVSPEERERFSLTDAGRAMLRAAVRLSG